MENTIKIKAGDTIKPHGIDERWLVAAVLNDYIYIAGYPSTCIKAENCTLIEACSPEAHLEILLEAVKGSDGRAAAAFWNLVDLQPGSVQARLQQLKQMAGERYDAYIEAEHHYTLFIERIKAGEFTKAEKSTD